MSGGGSGKARKIKKRKQSFEHSDGLPASKRSGLSRESVYSTVDDSILQYFSEVKGHFDGLDDTEERSRLALNALEETSGRELQIATDVCCSRILEALLPCAPTPSITQFCQALLSPPTFPTVIRNPFGSHVLESIIATLAGCLDDPVDGDSALDTLSKIVQEVTAQLYEYVMDRNASHVVRNLLCAIAGRNLLDVKGHGRRGGGDTGAASKRKEMFDLSAKLDARDAELRMSRERVAHPALLEGVVDHLCSLGCSHGYQEKLGEVMPFSSQGSAFLQTVLLAASPDRSLVNKLVMHILGMDPKNEGAHLLNATLISAMISDDNASHLLEAMIMLSPSSVKAQIVSLILSRDLEEMVASRNGNFVLQTALGACAEQRLVKAALESLLDKVSQMLWQRRAGVLLALITACSQNTVGEIRLGKAVISAYEQGYKDTKTGILSKGVAALLMLGVEGQLADVGHKKHMSPVGCAILARILSYPEEVAHKVAADLAKLSAEELVRTANDSAGSRVVEAALANCTRNKVKQKVIKKLLGSIGALATSPGGSHVVDKCFSEAAIKKKEAIVQELLKAQKRHSELPRVQALLRRCKVETYKQNPDLWKSSQAKKLFKS